MLLLDENMPASQQRWLRERRIRFRVIGVDIGSLGIKDENLIPILHRLPQPTFFSLDQDFCEPRLRHASYGLAWLDVADNRAAEFLRRFLRHPMFNTQAKRMGMVARVHAGGVRFWKLKDRCAQTVSWHDA